MEPVQRKIMEPQNILPGDFVYLCKPGTDVIVGFTVGAATHGNGSHCYTPKTSLTPYATGTGRWAFIHGIRAPFTIGEPVTATSLGKPVHYPKLTVGQQAAVRCLQNAINTAREKIACTYGLDDMVDKLDEQLEKYSEDPRLAPTLQRLAMAEKLFDSTLDGLREQLRAIKQLHTLEEEQ